ncbi:hypothetical protein ID866_3753 [Astraeus odoratus]|nr:hypothetical protein ID866_3753 [Astraeus odoratus]
MIKTASLRATVLAFAENQLGVSQAKIPEYYIRELDVHVAIAPHDLNFIVCLQPAQGYGIVTCMEPVCKMTTIVLGPSSSIPDGGLKRGFGSLHNYRAVTLERSASNNNGMLSCSVRSGTFLDMKAINDAATAHPPTDRLKHAKSLIPRKRQSPLMFVGVENDPLQEIARTPPANLEPMKFSFTAIDANGGIKAIHAVHTADPLVTREPQRDKARMAFEAAGVVHGPYYTQMSAQPPPPTNFQSTADPYFFDELMYSESMASGSQLPFGQSSYWTPSFEEADSETDIDIYRSRWTDFRLEETHGKGRDRSTVPAANPDDINKFFIAAGNAEQFDGNASVANALGKLGLSGLYSLLPGMAVSLMPHQAIGVAWALEREKSSDKGGCLGDEMGLGKTVQIIALMVANPSNKPFCKTNLIVAPLALLDQWKLEIETKTTKGMRCLIYHGAGKPKRKDELIGYDVVLTTYHTLALEWPDLEAEEFSKQKRKRKKLDSFIVSDSDEDRKGKRKRELGLLFQMQWYRIIIDEAQNIRNRRTRISRSVTDLESTYRWCLTGTPIVNGLVDAYPLFRFIQLRPWYDWEEFNSHISKIEKRNPSLATTRLQAIFKLILLRRKKDSLLDGKRLIELPAKTVALEKLAFSPEEREVYQMIEARSQAKFNRFLRAGTVLKNYHQVMLLRLRQICVHPALIQETCDALVASDELSGKRDLKAERARAARSVSTEFVSRLMTQYKELAKARMLAEGESADAVVDAEECPICMDAFTDAIVTACGHAFCRECIVTILNGPCAVDEENPKKYKGNEKACPSCRSPISADKIFVREAFEPGDDDLAQAGPSRYKMDGNSDIEMFDMSETRVANGKGKAKKRLRKKRTIYDSDSDAYDDDLSDFIVQDEEEKNIRRDLKRSKRKRMIVDSDDDIEEVEKEAIFGNAEACPPTGEIKVMSRFLPSTKMKKMIEHLLMWSIEHPDEKTIVVSQWTEALKLVSNYLTEHSVGHVKYQGSMNREQRDKAIRVFMLSDKAPVMLMSLKCGGVGLNLTRGNHLGWSEAIENQAFDRVHRLGQQRNVFVQRLVIENTVEDRILALQERKRNLADGSLGEGNGKKIGRLSVRELANLFGLDHRGNVL